MDKRKMLVSKVFHNNKVILSGMKHIWKKKRSTEKSVEDVKRAQEYYPMYIDAIPG